MRPVTQSKRTTRLILQELQAETTALRRRSSLLLFLVLLSFVAITFPETIAIFRVVLIGLPILFAVILLTSFTHAVYRGLRYRRAVKRAMRQGLFPVTNDRGELRGSEPAGGAAEPSGPSGPGGH